MRGVSRPMNSKKRREIAGESGREQHQLRTYDPTRRALQHTIAPRTGQYQISRRSRKAV